MSIFFSSPIDNCVSVTEKFLKLSKVNVTKNTIASKILEHPNHPSLLSISDALKHWNMDVFAASINFNELIEANTICIAQIKKEDDYFITIKKCSSQKVHYYDESNTLIEQSQEEFLKIWTGIVLFAEKTEKSGEENYNNERNKTLVNIILSSIVGISILFFAVSAVNNIININETISYSILFILKTIGVTVSIFLLWYDIDSYNPLLQKFCSSGKKVNCDAVLKSKGASIFLGIFNWSEIGFAYFSGTLVFLLYTSTTTLSTHFLGFISLFSTPIIILSLYYQAIHLKQFCLMCIAIQVLLSLEILTALSLSTYKTTINYSFILVFVSSISIFLLLWRILKPLLINSKNTIIKSRNFNKFKNNPNVFLGLLQASKKKEYSSKDIGITIGKNDAPYKITKVCNPYCPPCARAHPILDALVDRGLAQLQIIFNSSPDIDNKRSLPTKHLMTLAEKKDANLIHKALDDWYLSEKKDYEAFSKKYPLKEDVNIKTSKLVVMREWCDKESITHTPTIYINDYLLPEEYWVNDLVDVLI